MIKGHWVDCINPFYNPVNHAFYSHIPPHQSDLAKMCPVCWHEASKRNQRYYPTEPKKELNIAGYQVKRHANTQAKPHKDTL